MNDRKIKAIAFYLPQYYTFKENDEWWGKGFTEWVNVKKAQSLFSWHMQPQLPYNNFFYELNHNHHETMTEQINVAKEYGIYGFCFYHYWFKDGKRLLEIPVEKFLQDKTLNFNFCLSWANEPWTRAWDGGNKQIIMPQEYGEESEWINHFYYLLPYFKDPRYIKVDDKPLLVIYRPELINSLDDMLMKWEMLALKEGLEGIEFISQGNVYGTSRSRSSKISKFIMYEPGYTQATFSLRRSNLVHKFISDPRLFINITAQKLKTSIGKALFPNNTLWNTTILSYDLFWNNILNRDYSSNNFIPGAFIDWDNSPRRGSHGARIMKGGSPEKFHKYFCSLIEKIKNEANEDLLFITAWNEWAEGAHLEPDQINGYKYLEAIRDAIGR